jgi:hypothetical protein
MPPASRPVGGDDDVEVVHDHRDSDSDSEVEERDRTQFVGVSGDARVTISAEMFQQWVAAAAARGVDDLIAE